MSTHEEYEYIALMIDSVACVRVVPIRKVNGIRQNVLVSSLKASRRQCQRWSGRHSSRRRSRHGELGQIPDVQRTRSRQDTGKCQQIRGFWTLGGVHRPRAGELHTKPLQRLQDVPAVALWVLLPSSVGQKNSGAIEQQHAFIFFTCGTCDDSEARDTIYSYQADRAWEEELEERVEEQRRKLRDTQLEIEEAEIEEADAKSIGEGAHAEPRRIQQTLRDPLALQDLVPDLRACQQTKPCTQA